uniref:Reverse transcriptase domain-containing protein n=1 Tax=Podarcis muralis TaxID=64176 RepID=A0A670JUB4_PODMU
MGKLLSCCYLPQLSVPTIYGCRCRAFSILRRRSNTKEHSQNIDASSSVLAILAGSDFPESWRYNFDQLFFHTNPTWASQTAAGQLESFAAWAQGTGGRLILNESIGPSSSGSVRTGYGTTDRFKIGKGVRQGCMLSPCLFNLYAEFIMRKAGLDESQAGIKIAGRNINNLRYADDTTLMAESEEELKNLLMRVKEESAKCGLKLNIKKTKIMATGPITSWQTEGEEMEAVRDFTFLGSMITADGDSSHEIKRRLLLGIKAMTNLDSILKSRDITLPTKVRIVKAMVFPVVMYGSESWTIKKADRQRIDAFELWCWRRLLRVPWTARRSNLSILKEISPECSLEGQILKLRLQYFGHLMRREDSLEKTLMLGKMEGTRRRGRQRTRWLDSVLEATSMSLTKLQEAVEDRSAWRALVHGVTKRLTRLNNNNNNSSELHAMTGRSSAGYQTGSLSQSHLEMTGTEPTTCMQIRCSAFQPQVILDRISNQYTASFFPPH